MKHTSVYRILFITMVLTLFMSLAFSQNSSSGDTKKPSQKEMMARWQAAMTPGDMHKKLEFFVGSWNAESKIWDKGPNNPPIISKGNARYSLVFGGRYLKEDFKGEMMKQPFVGTGYTAYDNMKKKYTGTWIDNMGTAISTMEGSFDSDGKVLTFWGKMDDPMTGEMNKDVKYVYRIIDKNKHVFESFTGTSDQPDFQITYTRKK